jgi:hypothetical protein
MNTCVLHARGEYIVFIHDFMAPSADAVEQWRRSFQENGTKCVITGVAHVHEADPPDGAGDVTIWKNGPEGRIRPKSDRWVPETLEIFYTGFHISYFEATGGFDERCDGDVNWPLDSLFVQTRLHNWRTTVDNKLMVVMINHRKWQDEAPQWNANKIGDHDDPPGWTRWSQLPYNLIASRKKIMEERK